MTTLLFYLIAFSFTFASVMYTDKQFEDARAGWAKSKGKWHGWGAFQRSTPFLIALMIWPWYNVLFAASICIPAFEIGVNVIALHMPVFYRGSTSTMDKNFGKYKWYAMSALLLSASVIKFTSLKYPVADFFKMVGKWIYQSS